MSANQHPCITPMIYEKIIKQLQSTEKQWSLTGIKKFLACILQLLAARMIGYQTQYIISMA